MLQIGTVEVRVIQGLLGGPENRGVNRAAAGLNEALLLRENGNGEKDDGRGEARVPSRKCARFLVSTSETITRSDVCLTTGARFLLVIALIEGEGWGTGSLRMLLLVGRLR